MLAYYGYFGRARAEPIQGIQDQLEHLALVREKIAGGAARLDRSSSSASRRSPSLQASQAARARAVSAIDQQIKTRAARSSGCSRRPSRSRS